MTAAAAILPRALTWAGLTVYVAFLVTQSAYAGEQALGFDREDGSANRQDKEDADSAPGTFVPPPPPGSPTPYGPLPPPSPPFRDGPYGAHAYPSMPGSPSFLHPNFPEYQTRYGVWYQPRSFWEPTREVYRPQPFRPRGWGNLFVDDPCRHDRMDYNRYVVKDLPSRYGPSYYPLYQLPSECAIFRPELHYEPPVFGSAE